MVCLKSALEDREQLVSVINLIKLIIQFKFSLIEFKERGKTMKIIKILLLMLGMLLLFGCAGKVSMNPEVKTRLGSLAIDDKVQMPKNITLMTKGDALAIGLGGLIGGIIADSSLTEEEKLAKFLEDNKIDFSKMIKNEYKLALKKRPYYYNKLVSSNAQQTFKIIVNMYGLVYHHNIFSSDYVPTANIKFDLVDKNGKILWSETDFVTSYTDGTIRMPFDDYFKNPDNMRKALQFAAKKIANLVVSKLP